MNLAKPTITVVTACFNSAPYLAATMRSIQAQTFQDFEVLMVDDCSTDNSLATMHTLAGGDERFKVLRMHKNQGVVGSRNAALAQARGEYIAMLDSDDVWTSNALALRVDLARRYPYADVIATDFAWFEDEPPALPIGRVGLGPRGKGAFASSFATGEPALLADAFELVATIHFAWVGATLVRRSAMASIGNFEPSFEGPEDTLLWLRLAQRGAFVFAPHVTAYYRQRVGSLVHLRKGPPEMHYLKVLDWVRGRSEFATQRSVIRRLSAECHHISAQHYRLLGDGPSACRHALCAIKNQPQLWACWRILAAASMQSLRNATPDRSH